MDRATILDCVLHMTEDFDRRNEMHKESHKTFLSTLKAKLPDIVVSCFKSGTEIKFIELL